MTCPGYVNVNLLVYLIYFHFLLFFLEILYLVGIWGENATKADPEQPCWDSG